MGRLLESAAGRAFSVGESSRHETRRGGVPHGGRLSGRSRALTTRYHVHGTAVGRDRKSTRLNSSHGYISYAVFCLKKKKMTLPLTARLLLCITATASSKCLNIKPLTTTS